jgi:rubrerythrin
MASTNDITGARLVSKANTKEFEDNYDLIFGKKEDKVDKQITCTNCGTLVNDNDVTCYNCGQVI